MYQETSQPYSAGREYRRTNIRQTLCRPKGVIIGGFLKKEDWLADLLLFQEGRG